MLSNTAIAWLQLGNAAGVISTKQGDTISKMIQGKLDTADFSSESLADMATKATDSARKSGFKFSKSSLKELEGVKTELVLVVRRALELSSQDFTVFDGIRTLKEQQQHVANGTSQTMKSKHLDGLAVDLVPWVNGKPVWDWTRIYPIALAMDLAATEQGVANKIRWGGAWDRVLSDFGGSVDSYREECQAYANRHPGKDFLDGPHFEWVE